MPRPRFEKLEPARRSAILSVAAEEFAEHGFEAASYNRIIERSGLSKGAMYYYFDDKEDLFVTTLRDALQRLIVDVGNVQAASTAEEFWQEVTVWYRRSLQMLQADPAAIGLARSLTKSIERGSGSAALNQLRAFGRRHLDAFIGWGQHLGAIRSDLPDGLLPSVLMALEEGIDLWLLGRVADLGPEELDALARTLAAVYRRVAEPATPQRRKRPVADKPRKRKASS